MRGLPSLVLAGLALASQAPPRPAAISGQVVDAVTNEPIAGARVYVDRGQLPVEIATDALGRFSFGDLQAGLYRLDATGEGHLLGGYGQIEPAGVESRVDVLQGEQRSGLVVRLWKPSRITGHVRDDAGALLAGFPVRVLKFSLVGGRSRLSDDLWFRNAGTTTDARGGFVLADLVPGTYVVAVPSLALTRSPGSAAAEALGYPTMFYPSSPVPGGALAIVLGSGEERPDVEFRIPRVRMVNVSGQVTGGPVDRTVTPKLVLQDAGPSLNELEVATTSAQLDGSFVFRGVAPGSYVIRIADFSAPPGSTGAPAIAIAISGTASIRTRLPPPDQVQPPLPPTTSIKWAEVPVTVGDDSLTDVVVPVRLGGRIRGRVLFEGTRTKPSAAQLAASAMNVVGANRHGVLSPINTIEPDGAFAMGGLPPGKYQLQIRLAIPGWTIRSIERGGRDISGEAIDLGIADIDGLVITYTDRPAGLGGTVRNDRAEPSTDVSVLLFPAERRAWLDFGPLPMRLREVRTARDGSYHFGDVIPGEYFVTALTGPAASNWQTAAALESLAPLAVTVRIGVAQDVQQALRARPWR